MSVALEVWVKPVKHDGVGERYKVSDAVFNYVAIDESGRPRPIKK
jgi:acyl-CoA thioesterase YciA